jgi:hypothetical protein
MEQEKMANMADKIASAPDNDPALLEVGKAVDSIIASILILEKNIDNVIIEDPLQQKSKELISELLDTAISPYMMDIAKALNQLEGEKV